VEVSAAAKISSPRPCAQSDVTVYLLEHDALFDRDGIHGDKAGDFGDNLARYTFLSRGALRLCETLGKSPSDCSPPPSSCCL